MMADGNSAFSRAAALQLAPAMPLQIENLPTKAASPERQDLKITNRQRPAQGPSSNQIPRSSPEPRRGLSTATAYATDVAAMVSGLTP